MIFEALIGIALVAHIAAKGLEIRRQVREQGLLPVVNGVRNTVADAYGKYRAIARGMEEAARQHKAEKAERLAMEATQLEKPEPSETLETPTP